MPCRCKLLGREEMEDWNPFEGKLNGEWIPIRIEMESYL